MELLQTSSFANQKKNNEQGISIDESRLVVSKIPTKPLKLSEDIPAFVEIAKII